MSTGKKNILTINGGSSSIKFAVYELTGELMLALTGEIEKIGTPGARMNFTFAGGIKESTVIAVANHAEAAAFLVNWLGNRYPSGNIDVIGHRLVHGMQHAQPVIITTPLLNELKSIVAYDPEHLPAEIQLVEIFKQHYTGVPQVACFDTSFHTTMPSVARRLPLPRRYGDSGVVRYGFHGISYSYLMEELARMAGTAAASGKVILAHLGSGASLAAVSNGKSIDTSMGFTPAGGVLMGTRTGDLDPGVMVYLLKSEGLSATKINSLINHQSGLLGVSGLSSDMQTLLSSQDSNSYAAEAVEMFCYQAKKWIGSFAAALGGADTLVFSGGIGERSAEIRSRICSGLGFAGIEINEQKNNQNGPVISSGNSKVTVMVIATNEEQMIARLTCDVVSLSYKN